MVIPGTEMKPLVAELRERILEELDYAREADTSAPSPPGTPATRSTGAQGRRQRPQGHHLEWVDGTSLNRIVANGTREQRDGPGAAHRTAFRRAGPGRPAARRPASGQLPAHRRRPAGRHRFRVGGPAADGAPPIIGKVTRLALEGHADLVVEALRGEGFIPPGYHPDPELLMDYVVPFVEPLRHETFHFTRPGCRRSSPGCPTSPVRSPG